jgi:hypothetical protein
MPAQRSLAELAPKLLDFLEHLFVSAVLFVHYPEAMLWVGSLLESSEHFICVELKTLEPLRILSVFLQFEFVSPIVQHFLSEIEELLSCLVCRSQPELENTEDFFEIDERSFEAADLWVKGRNPRSIRLLNSRL